MTGSQVLVAGRYQLVGSLGFGGMGRVWLARDEVLDREVAIKEVVLPFGLAQAEREELVVRTLREARMAARLNHPNVVRIYDVVRTDEQPWIVMEYVRSRSLLQVIREEGPLPAVRVAEIGLAVLSALAASHRAGVLHRDVKPSNVLIADDDRVMLTDFGLATFEEGDNAVTRPGLILGSPHYIAPERAREGVATAKSDLWSLGATLYAAVEGRSPYARASTIATLTALATERPDPVVHAGPLKPVLDGLLRRNPRTRFDVADAERLLRRVAGTGAGKRSSSPIPRRSPRPRTLADLNTGVQRDGDGSPALFGQPGGTGRNGRPIGTAQPTGNGRPTVTTGQAGNGHPTGNGHRADAGRSVPAAPVGTARVRVPGPTGTAGSTTGGVPATAAQATGRVPGPPAESTGDLSAPPPVRRHPVRWIAAAAALTAVGGLVVSSGGHIAPSAAAQRSAAERSTAEGSAAQRSTGKQVRTAQQEADAQKQDQTPPVMRVAPAPRPPETNDTPLPAGWIWYHNTEDHYQVAVPADWPLAMMAPHEAYFCEPNGARMLVVSPLERTGGDVAADLGHAEGEQIEEGEVPGYQRIRIDNQPDYRDRAADWEYTYIDHQRGKMHGLNRGFDMGDRSFLIEWRTKPNDWAGNVGNFNLVADSFWTPRIVSQRPS